MGSSPKAPKPTAEEKFAERRQVEELTRLDEEENKRIKRIKRVGTASQSQRASPNVQGVGPVGAPAANGGRVMRAVTARGSYR